MTRQTTPKNRSTTMIFEQTLAPAAGRTIRRLVAIAAAAGVAMSASFAIGPAPASAVTTYSAPSNFICGNARVAISPPRAWANRGRTETVVWGTQLERWNGSRWYTYSKHFTFGRFNHFGQNLTSWSAMATSNGGRYINSRYHVPVYHKGYYRVGAVLAGPGLQYAGYVGGEGTYCRIY